MTILVTGSTGTIGKQIVELLAQRGAKVRALVRGEKATSFPAGVTAVRGDLTDVTSLRRAFEGVDTLFLLNAVAPDELTQALLALDAAQRAGVRGLVYLSVFNGATYKDVPHFVGKYTVEQAIDHADLPATVLRPAFFMQNDAALKQALLEHAVYPMPVGPVGLNMVDTRDVAEVAAIELLRRDSAGGPLPRSIVSVVGPDRLTGTDIAAVWADVLGRKVTYGGDDLDAFEARVAQFAPPWSAADLRLMARGFQEYGMIAKPTAVATLETLLGRPLRTYRDFARETAAAWARG